MCQYRDRLEFDSRLNTPPRRHRGVTVSLALAMLLAFALVTLLAGCGGGKRGPRPEPPPPVPSPLVTPHPATGALDGGTFAYAATREQLHDIAAHGVRLVLDYAQESICERTDGTGLRLIFPLYFGKADDPTMMDRIVADQSRNVAACRERVAMLFVADEPALHGVPPRIVNAWLASARRAFPGIPTLIYEPKDSDLQRYAVDVRGLSAYGPDSRDAAKVAKRLARQPHAAGQRYAIVARGFVERDNICCGGAYGRWTPAQVATALRVLAAEARATGHVRLLLPYLAQENASANNPAPNWGWLDFPETRAAMKEVGR